MNLCTLAYAFGRVTTAYTPADTLKNPPASTSKDSTKKSSPLNTNFISLKGTIQYSSTYIDGAEMLFGLNGFYNSISLQNQVTLWNVPITIGILGVSNQGTINNYYYTYNVSFNSAALEKELEQIIIDKLKKEAKKKYDSIYGKTIGPIQDSVKRFESIKNQLNDPKTLLLREKNQTAIDSLENLKSKGQSIDGKVLDSLKSSENKYNSLQSEFYRLMQIEEKALNYESQLNVAMAKYEAFFKQAKNMNDSSLMALISSNGMVSNWQKELMAVKNLGFGQSTLYYSPFTLNGVLFNGFSAEINPGPLYASVAYGNQVSFSPLFNQFDFYSLPFKRKIMYAKVGEGSPTKSHLYFSYTNISDGALTNNNLQNTFFPRNNTIYSLEAQQYLSKAIYFKAEIAHSILKIGSSSEINSEVDTTSKTLTNNSAISTEANATLPKTKTSFNVHFSNVGKEFITLGNPYLINGAIDYGAFLRQDLLKSKLHLKIGLDQINSNPGTNSSFATSGSSLNYSISYDLGKIGSFQVEYLPNSMVMNNGIGNQPLMSQQNLFIMTGNLAYKVGKVRMTSTINANNYTYSTNFFEGNTNQFNNQLVYYNLTQNIMLPTGNYVSVFADWANNNWFDGEVEQYVVQSSYSFTIKKKMNFSFGGNLSRMIYNPPTLGCLGSIQIPVFKISQLSISADYKNYINSLTAFNGQIYIMSSVFVNW